MLPSKMLNLQFKAAVYCAFCKTRRLVYSKKHVHFFDIFISIAGGLSLGWWIWKGADLRAWGFAVLFMIIGEFFVRMRRRLSIICPHCGFDPIVYLKNPSKAAETVRLHLKNREEDPLGPLLRPLHLPRRRDPPQDSQNL